MDTTSTSGPQAAEQMQAGASGYDAAQQPQTPAATAAPSAGGGSPTAIPAGGAQAPASSGAAIASQPMPSYTTPTRTMTPVKRGGLLGVVDGIADVLAGKTTPEIYKDQDGNAFIKPSPLSRSQQWERIGAEAFTGAMKGMAAGKGAGNLGKAGAAGVDQGEEMAKQRQQQEKDMTAEARQQTLDNANNQMLRMNMAEQTMKMAAMKTKATEDDINFAEEQTDRLVKEGGTVIGTMSRPDELRNILKVNPDVMKDMIEKHQIEIMPHYNPDGSPGGFKVIKMPDGYRSTMLPAGAEFKTFDQTTGQYLTHKSSDPITQGEVDDYNHAAGIAGVKFATDKQEADQKAQAIAASKATASEAPSKIAENLAEASEHRALASKAYEDAAVAKAQAATAALGGKAVGDLPPALQQTVRGLANYSVDPATFPQRTYAKGGQMDRETAVGLAKQIDPDYDETQYKSRSKTRSDFASGKARQTINSLNQAVNHLDRMSRSAKALNNTSTRPVNAMANWWIDQRGDSRITTFQDDANAVQNEMATVFKGTGATDQEIKAWRDKISSSQSPKQLSDGVHELLQLMNGRLRAIDDQWNSSMGTTRDFHILSPDSVRILHALGGDELIGSDQTNMRQEPQAAAPPAGATGQAKGPDGKMHWADASGKDYGPVQ
jgi:hypothetical protein